MRAVLGAPRHRRRDLTRGKRPSDFPGRRDGLPETRGTAVQAGLFIEFRHQERTGGDNYYLRWNGPDSGGAWQIVPATAFTGLTETFYDVQAPSSTITDYVVRVRVGVPSMPEANCKQYPNGTYKPVGLLQRHGEAGRMYFGLLTGSYDDNTDGGILRKRIGPITDEINPTTGQIIVPAGGGIIDTINKFRIIGFRYSDYAYQTNCGWITTRALDSFDPPDASHQGHCRMWGNPVGEMMYEGLRYFAGKMTPTTSFTDATASSDDASLGLPTPTWDDPYTTFDYCAKPFMLVLSDIFPTYDSDSLPGSYFNPSFTGDLSGLDVEDLANEILTEEGEEGYHYVGQLGTAYDGSCYPKDIQDGTSDDGLGDVRGLCPEEPTKRGSYYAASVAYYGRTHDISAATGTQNVLTYIVGLASALPRITIPIGDQTVTLIPFAKSCGGCMGPYTNFQPTNTITDFFVQEITPTYGKFRINYEDVEQGADHDMDAIVVYEYTVTGSTLTITLTSTYASGSIVQHCGYIISGTTKDGTYLEVRDYDTGAGSDPDYFLDTPPGVWAGESGDPWDDNTALPLTTTRTFTAGTTTAATLLESPLWYAAKWGGFNDLNDNDKPDLESEWDEDADGTPDTYFYVVNPLKLEQQLNRTFTDILSRGVSHVAPVVSVDEANRTQSGDKLYMAFFRPMPDSHWQGNLKKYGLSYLTRTDCGRTEPEWTVVDKNDSIAGQCDGAFKPASTSYWSTEADGGYVDRGGVGALLKAAMPGTDPIAVPATGPYYDFRNIYTYKGAGDGSMVRFTDANITNSDLSVSSDTVRYNIINFMYGYTYDSDTGGVPVAKREWIMGDIIHSEPRIIDYFNADGSLKARYIAVGANDGMLHVFTDQDCTIGATSYPAGSEIFAFVPRDLLPRLQEFGTPDVHTFMVDGSSNLFRAQTQTGGYYDKTLVFGERRGGRSYWALDVTNPDPSNWKVRWHIEGGTTGTTGFEELGYTWSKPYFARIRTDASTVEDVVIFAGGYDYPLEDGFPEGFDDANENGIWDYTDANGNGAYDVGEASETHAVTIGGTEFYDKYNPGNDTMGRGIFVLKVSDGSVMFKATYGDADGDEDESEDVTTGLDQKYCKMKYCFPADISAIPFSDTDLVIYLSDIYGQVWKVVYDYYGDTSHTYTDPNSEKWSVTRVFTANPGSDLASGDADAFDAGTQSLVSSDRGRKAFYSPDISYFGTEWTTYPVLYFGTGDRAHPRLRMISNRFYAVADRAATDGQVLDETDLLNLTCDELDDDADADGDGDVDDDDAIIQENLKGILRDQSPCRGFYRIMDKQGDCTDDSTDHTGEQVLSQPTLFFKTVYFTSYQAVYDDPCNPVGNAFIYAIDYSWGTSAIDFNDTNDTDRNLSDTFQVVSGSSIPSGVRVITREGHAAGLLSAGGAIAGAGKNLATNIPGPPGGVSQMLWETE